MATTIVDNPEAERFELYHDGEYAGAAVYHRTPHGIAFLHTEIEPAFQGKGLGSVLARHVLDDARERGLEVLPHCPYIRGWIARHPDYVDLVPERRRAEFGL